MKNKVSLLKDCISADTFSGKAEKDEMIIFERNKVSYGGMNALMCILLVFGIWADIVDLRGCISQYICMAIGIVNYGMLITFCYKGIVKHHAAFNAFIWSFFTLPLSIVNLFLDKIVVGKIYVIVLPIEIVLLIVFVAVVIFLYIVSDFIYKKSSKED